jgi:hypothetical protein
VRYGPTLLILRMCAISDPMASLVIALVYNIRVGLGCIIALSDMSVFSIVIIGDYWFIWIGLGDVSLFLIDLIR